MQQSQEPGASFPSGQLPNSISTPTVKPAPRDSRGVFAAWENVSLKTQQIVIASTAAAISALVMLSVIPIASPDVTLSGDAVFSLLLKIGMIATLTGVLVGAITWALGQIAIARLSRNLDSLQAQFAALARGNLDVRLPEDSSDELGQLSMSFNEMARSLNQRIEQAQQKLEEQEREKENLHQKLKQIVHNIESSSESDLAVWAEGTASEDDEQDGMLPGTLPDFLDNLHGWSKVTTAPELLLGSSTLEEVLQRKEELEYRRVWLQALQNETQRELKILSLIGQSPDKEQVRETNDG